MTGDELEDVITSLGWTKTQFAAKLKLNNNTVTSWFSGKRRIPEAVVLYLDLLRKLNRLVDVMPEKRKRGDL